MAFQSLVGEEAEEPVGAAILSPQPSSQPVEQSLSADPDNWPSYARRGQPTIKEGAIAQAVTLMPALSRLRMLRTWGGIVDVTPDRSPILGKTPVKGLYVNCGWGTGGFKATPGAGDLLAYTMARDEPHPINAPYNLDRFRNGRLIDEAAAAAVAH